MYLVGVDVGTTNTKAVIFDVDTGQVRAIGSSRTTTRHPKTGWSEFDAEELWQTVLQSIRAAIQQCEQPERIRAISVASMGESGFPLDAQGNVLYPAIAWHDQRTTAEAQWWEETLGAERVFEITGQLPLPIFGVNKLLWLRSNLPQIFERIQHWLSIEDFVLWKLSGSFATDYSIASRTMLFDQRKLDWSASLLQHSDLPADWFPPALPSGTSLGAIRKDVAAETGLPPHTLICTGGHDHLCGALAAGVTHSGQLLESMGTASVLLALSDIFQPSSELLAAGCMSYAYVIQHTYVTIGMLNFAGGALEWIVKLLYGQGQAEDVSDTVYTLALREAAEIPPGSRGATILPYFLGAGTPYKNSPALGAILGLTPYHDRPELVRAIMEGLAFWLRDNILKLCSLNLAPSRPEIIVVGGTTQARPFLQIKANATGCPIKAPQITEAAATGAALLAGMGANIFRSGAEAASSLQHAVEIFEPEAQAVEAYNTIYTQTYLPACHSILKF